MRRNPFVDATNKNIICADIKMKNHAMKNIFYIPLPVQITSLICPLITNAYIFLSSAARPVSINLKIAGDF